MSSKVLSKNDGWIGQITPSRPKVLNTIDDDLPGELANAVTQAHAEPDVRLMILSGAERGAIRRPRCRSTGLVQRKRNACFCPSALLPLVSLRRWAWFEISRQKRTRHGGRGDGQQYR
jgi:hypothetical protein